MAEDRKCQKVTRAQQQCSRSPVKGSEFCWLHQPREAWNPTIVCTILGIIFGFLIALMFFHQSKIADDRRTSIDRARMIPPIRKFPVILAKGSNSLLIEGPNFYQASPPEYPFSFMVGPDHKIQIFGAIRSLLDKIAVQAEGTSIRALPGSGFDINSDERAIEVVDENNNPVFQLRILSFEQWQDECNKASKRHGFEVNQMDIKERFEKISPEMPQEMIKFMNKQKSLYEQVVEVVQVNYIAVEGSYYSFVTPYGSQERENPSDEEIKKWRNSFNRIFKYPGHVNPGKRVLTD